MWNESSKARVAGTLLVSLWERGELSFFSHLKAKELRQKEVMESVSCFVPSGVSRAQNGVEISLSQSNSETE